MVEPQLAPRGTSVQSFSASEMEVSWNAIAWNRNTGRVLGYEVIHIDLTLHLYAGVHYTITLHRSLLSCLISCHEIVYLLLLCFIPM